MSKKQRDEEKLPPLHCPRCGALGGIGRIDLVPGHATVLGITLAGELVWGGDTHLDWNEQEAANDPPLFHCNHCHAIDIALWELTPESKGAILMDEWQIQFTQPKRTLALNADACRKLDDAAELRRAMMNAARKYLDDHELDMVRVAINGR